MHSWYAPDPVPRTASIESPYPVLLYGYPFLLRYTAGRLNRENYAVYFVLGTLHSSSMTDTVSKYAEYVIVLGHGRTWAHGIPVRKNYGEVVSMLTYLRIARWYTWRSPLATSPCAAS